MSAEYEDLPIPSARQLLEGKWGPHTSEYEKLESVKERMRERISQLMNFMTSESHTGGISPDLSGGALADAICYVGGANAKDDILESISMDIVMEEKLLKFLLEIDLYRFIHDADDYFDADYSQMHEAANNFIKASKITKASDSNDNHFHQCREELIAHVKNYLSYLRERALVLPLRIQLAKTLTGAGSGNFSYDAIKEPRLIKLFTALEEILFKPYGKGRFMELTELSAFLTELQMEYLRLAPH